MTNEKSISDRLLEVCIWHARDEHTARDQKHTLTDMTGAIICRADAHEAVEILNHH